MMASQIAASGRSELMQNRPSTRCRLMNLHRECDAIALVQLINAYAADPMGRGRSLERCVLDRLMSDLARIPTARVIVAEIEHQSVGIAICFLGYSTFGGARLLNVHDFYVASQWRRTGVGRKLIHAVDTLARREQCCKVTLEVRADNQAAQALYKSEGFADCDPPMLFWTRTMR